MSQRKKLQRSANFELSDGSDSSFDCCVKSTHKFLPDGWRSIEVLTKSKRRKVHIEAPNGARFKSKKTLAAYIENNNLPYSPDDFVWSRQPWTKTDLNNETVNAELPHGGSLSPSNSYSNEMEKFLSISPSDSHILENSSPTLPLKGHSMAMEDLLKRNEELEKIICEKTALMDQLAKDLKNIKDRNASSNLEEDISILVNNGWITDSIIDLCLNHSISSCDLLLCIPASLTCLFKCAKSLNDIKSNLLPMEDKRYLACFVNDSFDTELFTSGSHWSLLIFDFFNYTCHHFDSFNGENAKHAKIIVNNISKVLQINFQFNDENTHTQSNTFDCGFECLGNLEQLKKIINRNKPIDSRQLLVNDTVSFRKQVSDLYLHLKYKKGTPPKLAYPFQSRQPINFHVVQETANDIASASSFFPSNTLNFNNVNSNKADTESKNTVIFGDSLLRNINQFINTDFIDIFCFPGLTLEKFDAVLRMLPVNNNIEHVILSMGSNDLKKARSSDHFLGDYWATIDFVKVKFPLASITICSIVKRRDINARYLGNFNANLKWLSERVGTRYLDFNVVMDYCHLNKGGIHFTRYGTKVFGCFLRRFLADCVLIKIN